MSTIEYNGRYWTVTTSGGETWTFEDEDTDMRYIDNAIEAWTAWKKYVEESGLTPDGH